MDRHSDSDLTLPIHRQPTLDEAIEYCVLALERGVDPNSPALLGKFPQWRNEIASFLEDWAGMERRADNLLTTQDRAAPAEQLSGTLGDYELIEEVGRGGMGVIYKARQISLDRIVALKMIVGERHDHERFRMEAEAAAALAHPNIASIYEIGDHDGRPYFSMQLIEGCDLRRYLDRGKITCREAARITKTVAQAVHYAHLRGILHRDLKPANIMMDSDGQPHITDFGLAKRMERDAEVTRSGTIVGTPGYMSPGQAAGKNKDLTIATDVYGVGAILYALLTGDAPFTGDSSFELLRKVVEEPPQSPRVQRADIDRDLETICLKCLEKAPELRYGSPGLLAEDLERYVSDQPVLARPITSGERFWRWCCRNPLTAALSSAVIVLLLATTLFSSLLALSERNARKISEQSNRRENNLRSHVNQAIREEQEAVAAATETRAQMFLSNGLQKAREGAIGEALLWWSEAASLAEQPEPYLLRCQHLLRQHPFPLAAIWLPKGYGEVQKGKRERISFHPDAPQLLCEAGPEFVVWNYQSGDQWDLHQTYPGIKSATWSPDGRVLAVGKHDGGLLIVDAITRNVHQKIHLAASVDDLAFSPSDTLLAIASGKVVRVWDMTAEQFVGDELTHPQTIHYLSFNSDGDRLVTAHGGKQARVYEVGEEVVRQLFNTPCSISSASEYQRPFWPTFSGDLKSLAVRTDSTSVSYLDSSTGDQVGEFEIAPSTYSISVADNGDVSVAGGDGVIKLMRADTPAGTDDLEFQVAQELVHGSRIITTAFGSAGLIATGGWDQTVRLWQTSDPSTGDTPGGKTSDATLRHQTRLRQVMFSRDRSVLATVQIDGLIRLWQIPDPNKYGYSIPVGKGGSLAKLVGRHHWMTSGISQWSGDMANVSLYQTKDGQAIGGMKGLTIPVESHILDASCSFDQTQLVTAHAGSDRSAKTMGTPYGGGGTLRFWSFPDGQAMHAALPMPSEPRWVTHSPRDDRLAVCTARMQIVLVNTDSFEVEATLRPADQFGEVFEPRSLYPTHQFNEQLAFSPDGGTIVAWSTKSPGIWVWDVETRTQRFPWIDNDGWPVAGLEFSPNGKQIVMSGGRNTVVRVLDIESGEFVSPDIKHSAVVYTARFSPDGQRVVTASRDGQTRVFDWRTGELVFGHLKHSYDTVEATYTPDSRFILTIGWDNLLKVWNANDGSLATKPISCPPRTRQLLVTPDSRFVILAGGTGAIHVVDLGDLQQELLMNMANTRRAGEFLANKTISNGSMANLTTSEWYSRWLEQGPPQVWRPQD